MTALASPPEPQARPRSRHVLVAAERAGVGSTEVAPDTLMALRGGAHLNVDYVEIDVRRTKDGIFVVASDPDVSTMGQTCPIESRTFDAIAMVTGTPMIELTEALAIIGAAGKRAHIDLKVSSPTIAYQENANTHEAAALEQMCSILPVSDFIVSSSGDDTVRAVATWAEEHQAQVRIGLALGYGPGGEPRLRLAELFPGARVKRSGANFVVSTPRLASLRLLDWAKDAKTPIVVAGCPDQASIGRFVSDNRTWMVSTAVPHLAPRHRAASPPLWTNTANAIGLTVIIALFLLIGYALAGLALGFETHLPGPL